MADPILQNWRLILGDAKALGILVGQVTGHPKLLDGWITTSVVEELADDHSWAVTRSRRYVLGKPIPADQSIPPGGTDAVLNRLFRAYGTVTLAELDKLVARANALSKAPNGAAS